MQTTKMKRALLRAGTLALLGSMAALISCECDTACEGLDDSEESARLTEDISPDINPDTPSDSSSSSSSSSSNGSSNAPSLSYLDCSNLDPGKVYFLGKFVPFLGDHDALIDLDDPSTFCVGFAGDMVAQDAKVSATGELLGQYTDTEGGRSIHRLVQETLGERETESGWEWVYPQDTMENDEKLFTTTQTSYNFFLDYNSDTDTNDIYYQRYYTGRVYSNLTDATPYYENPNSLGLISVLPGGSLLMDDDDGLYVVDTELNETALELPDDGAYFFEATSRVFEDSETGNTSVWILVQDDDFTNDRRWRIDLETLTVTDDGLFAAAPEIVDLSPIHINPNTQKPLRGNYKKLDAEGNLIQIAEYSSPPQGAEGDISDSRYSSLILRRPIASSGEPSTVLHSDAEYSGDFEWRTEPNPFVHIVGGGLLITGP